MQKIFFRVDGNDKIATGHVMRCLSYALFFKSKGYECVFITADEYMHSAIKQKDFACLSLGSKYDDMLGEVQKFKNVIIEYKPSVIVIDSYFVNEYYLKQITSLAKTIYIDDLNSFDYPVNAILNYSVYANTMNYNAKGKQLFLGMEYFALRPEFMCLKNIEIKKDIKDIFITTGGSDNYSFVKMFLTEQSRSFKFNDYNYHVIVGSFFKSEDKDFLLDLQNNCQNVTIYQNIANMGEVMSACDVAISAGGSTLYELAYLGVPTIAIITAENQRLNVETFAKKQAMLAGGDYTELLAKKVSEALQKCTWEKRLSLAHNALACYGNDKKLDLLLVV